jgi:flavin-dependent dehydrogenase
MEIQAGIAVSRPAFDGGLLEAALKMGTDFLPETCASLGQSAGETRTVVLRQHERTAEIKSRLVLLADGLGGRFFQRARRPEMVIEKNSWIGAGVVVPSAPEFYCTHAIFMACGSHGYVGLVRLEDGHLNIAAAFDPRFVKHWHHPGRAAETILADAGFPPIVGLSQWDWRGTPPLTRRISPRAMHRIFVLGDAAGYVQPFTGEGIGWALAAGLAVSDLAIRGAEQWHASLEREWHHLYQKTVASRQFLCKALALVLRHRILTSAMIAVLFRFPKAANPFLRRLHLNSAQLRPNLQFKASSWDRN